MRYMLDTNMCIYIIKRAPASVYSRFSLLKVGDVCLSAITCCELQFGVANSSKPEQNRLALARFLSPLEILDFPSAAAGLFGTIKARLNKSGTPIGGYDLLIAAHALHERLTLVTNNVREFAHVPGLKVENWVAGD